MNTFVVEAVKALQIKGFLKKFTFVLFYQNLDNNKIKNE